MSKATLTIDRSSHAPNARAFVVDCEHGTTTVTVFDAPDPAKRIADGIHARLAVARHYEALGDEELAGALASHYLAAYEASAEGAEADFGPQGAHGRPPGKGRTRQWCPYDPGFSAVSEWDVLENPLGQPGQTLLAPAGGR